VLGRRRREAEPEQIDLSARGWIEGAFGDPKDGMFAAEPSVLVSQTWFTFMLTGATFRETQRISWQDVNSVQVFPRSDIPESVVQHHATLFSWKGLTDPNVIIGWLTSVVGVPKSDMFVLLPIEPLGTSEQWVNEFRRAGVKIDE
jgi:hypothetical protein